MDKIIHGELANEEATQNYQDLQKAFLFILDTEINFNNLLKSIEDKANSIY
jgi:hypothetical protein